MEFDERRYRPLSTVDLFDEAFDLYKRNFVLLLLIAACVVVPATILTDIAQDRLLPSILGPAPTDSQDAFGGFAYAIKQSAVTAFLGIPFWAFAFPALTAAISDRYLGKPITVGRALITGLRRFSSSLVSSAIYNIMLWFGVGFLELGTLMPEAAPIFAVVGVPIAFICIILAVARYSLYMGALVAEKLGPLKALKRSSELSKTDTGRVVWTIICMVALVSAVSIVLEQIAALFDGSNSQTSMLTVSVLASNQSLVESVASGVADLVLTPLMAITLTLVYYDQRIRKEGFDMEILAERLGYPPISALNQAAYTPLLTTPAGKRRRK